MFDFSGKTLEDLRTMESERITEFDSLYGEGENLSTESFNRCSEITEEVTAIRAEIAERESRVAKVSEFKNSLSSKTPDPGPDPEPNSGDEDNSESSDEEDNSDPALFQTGVAVTSEELGTVVTASVTAVLDKVFASDVVKEGSDLNKNLRLGRIANYAPDASLPERKGEAVLVASADVPGFVQGGKIEDLEKLAEAMHVRARALPVSRSGNPNVFPVANLKREFTFNLDMNSTPAEMNEVLKAATDPQTLVAAGGWCAPSEILYDFFNVAEADGLVDIPSIGVMRRGGIQHPTSPSFGDVADIEDIGWTWTEADDIAAADNGPSKPCVRVQCPEFVERRLDCDGFCVLAGNLTDWAYPELIANWLSLVFTIRARATNRRIINLMLNGGGSGDDFGPSTAVNHTGLLGASTAALLNSIELSAIDYRERFSMSENAILEVVMPRWAVGLVRADLANRNGVENFLAVTNAQIADWFNSRQVRVQFVSDWQVRDNGGLGGATPAVNYPNTTEYMIYAPGTFVRGSGLTLDLGVVRDSVLNEKNDHTAAWVEECYLVAKPGHESRVVTVANCISGEVGAATFECGEFTS
jgi:hypothetical protein